MSEKNIYQRIAEIMNDVSYVPKEKAGSGLPYTFASHDAVTKLIRPAILKHGVVAIPTIIDHVRQDGNLTIMTIKMDFINIDNPTDRVCITAIGYGVDKQDKGPGKAFSYACKYAMLKAFCLETGDDPEKDDIDVSGEPVPTITDSQVLDLVAECDKYGFESKELFKKICTAAKIKNIEDLQQEKYQMMFDNIKRKYDREQGSK